MRRSFTFFAVLLLSCGSEDAPPPEPPPPLPDDLVAFYEALVDHASTFAEMDGQWTEDYGDAPFYGLAMHLHVGQERDDPAMLAVADRARAHAVEVVRQANADRDWYLANMEEALMAALGLIERVEATGDHTDVADIDEFIDATNDLLFLFSDYLPTGAEIGSFALEVYGPTAITAAVALLNLQYAANVEGPRAPHRLARARQIVSAIDRNAWAGDHYAFAPDVERLYLYPSSMMMLVLARLYELEGDDARLERAVAVAESLAPLRSERGGYLSPYSAEIMGATTDDYTTLSSQNYLALALALLYQHTRDRRWFDEMLFVLDFSRQRLFDPAQGHMLHHWMDGRIAQPDDLEYWCSGCNMQFAYVVWYVRARVLV